MKITVIGTGYVGLVSGTCLADDPVTPRKVELEDFGIGCL